MFGNSSNLDIPIKLIFHKKTLQFFIVDKHILGPAQDPRVKLMRVSDNVSGIVTMNDLDSNFKVASKQDVNNLLGYLEHVDFRQHPVTKNLTDVWGDSFLRQINGDLSEKNQEDAFSVEEIKQIVSDFNRVLDKKRKQREKKKAPPGNQGSSNQEKKEEIGFLVHPDSRHEFESLVISEKARKQIEVGLQKINLKEFLNNTWNLKSIEPMDGRVAMNFFGKPGTGKTLTALAVAKKLGKPMLQVDYSQIVSKWVGDTGKHLKAAFDQARKNDAILFFDEADSLLSRRISLTSDSGSSAVGSNQDRNILMNEMDKFDGVIIFTSNFFENYDEAMLRRIAQHVEFELPNQLMRVDLLKRHIPSEVPCEAGFEEGIIKLAAESDGLSGGDIKNMCLNAIIAAAMRDHRVLAVEDLVSQLRDIKQAKRAHQGTLAKRPIGILG